MSLARVLACAVLAALTSPVVAQQQAEPGSSDPIVVTGRTEQPSARQVNRQAREITEQGNLRRAPLARFEDRLCPGILGLKDDFAALMIDRIRDNAKQLDMWMGDDSGCQPNLIVAFVDDGQAELRKIAAGNGYALAGLSTRDRERLLNETGPVRVWTTTEMRSRDGIPMSDPNNGGPPTVGGNAAHSKIYLAVRNDITQVVVLFNREGVRGKTLVQLADYATMRGLARTKPLEDTGEAGLDSILALFTPNGGGPGELTGFDRAYLANLYGGIPNLPGVMRVGGVAGELRRQARAEE